MFTKILVPVDIDYPEAATAVYQKAAALAKLSGAKIRLISVMPGFGMPLVASYISEEVRQEAADRFKKALEQFINDNCRDPVSYELRTGKNWEEIIKAADKWGADLIVVYHNRRREINEVFSRSCSQRVADHANCSVLRLRNIRT
ncbi:MAG: universal stress protein [Desulfobacterales bacterium]|jgi:nucleotide-binding universal stress UspA family protein